MSEVSFSECLEIINRKDVQGNPVPFDANIYTLNRNTKKGGVLKIYKGVKLLAFKKGDQNLKGLVKQATSISNVVRKPNHFANRTRNIELPNGAIKKIKVRLIDSINGKKVVP